MQNGPVRYDADRLASLSFNPLLHNIISFLPFYLVSVILVNAHSTHVPVTTCIL